jgi:hypothetical protein
VRFSGVLAWADGVVDSKPHLFGLYRSGENRRERAVNSAARSAAAERLSRRFRPRPRWLRRPRGPQAGSVLRQDNPATENTRSRRAARGGRGAAREPKCGDGWWADPVRRLSQARPRAVIRCASTFRSRTSAASTSSGVCGKAERSRRPLRLRQSLGCQRTYVEVGRARPVATVLTWMVPHNRLRSALSAARVGVDRPQGGRRRAVLLGRLRLHELLDVGDLDQSAERAPFGPTSFDRPRLSRISL